MITSFIVAVFVLPSFLALWARFGPGLETATRSPTDHSIEADD